MTTIRAAAVIDLRFPTSRTLYGSDAMNPDPDYSAAYLELSTSDPDLTGCGFVFTIGRGNDIQAAAVAAVADRLVGRSLDELLEDPGAINRELTWDSQLRWLGPDKGVIHMAVGAVMNAVWDLRSKRERRPLWATLGHLEPAEVVALVDWTYLADFLDPAHAREMLEERRSERDSRIADLHRDGLAADPSRLALEYVDHLHEHMAQPVEVTAGCYRLPTQPGAGTAFRPATADSFAYPEGAHWREGPARPLNFQCISQWTDGRGASSLSRGLLGWATSVG